MKMLNNMGLNTGDISMEELKGKEISNNYIIHKEYLIQMRNDGEEVKPIILDDYHVKPNYNKKSKDKNS